MYLSPLEGSILHALRHGALDHFQVAVDVAAAPFMVRGSLKRLKSERLVRESLDADAHDWELTSRGYQAVHDAQQTILGVDL
jgi:hypothetical protein